LVAGPIEPRDGQAIPAKTKKVRLCRCGASTKKPFWDGTHSKAGFRREGTASP
jgi:3-phenylpropionate/trans-cinnamate dioxygenase ferredoxin subunit